MPLKCNFCCCARHTKQGTILFITHWFTQTPYVKITARLKFKSSEFLVWESTDNSWLSDHPFPVSLDKICWFRDLRHYQRGWYFAVCVWKGKRLHRTVKKKHWKSISVLLFMFSLLVLSCHYKLFSEPHIQHSKRQKFTRWHRKSVPSNIYSCDTYSIKKGATNKFLK